MISENTPLLLRRACGSQANGRKGKDSTALIAEEVQWNLKGYS
jgi:hypothetical protein